MVETFLKEMGKYPKINQKETLDIIKEGGPSMADKIIKGHWRLVVSIVKKTIGFVSLDEINTGLMALSYAAERYKPRAGYYFTTYATFVVRSQIMRNYNHEKTTLSIPYTAREKFNDEESFKRYKNELKNALSTISLDDDNSIYYTQKYERNNGYISLAGLSEQEDNINRKIIIEEIQDFVEENLSETEKIVFNYRILQGEKIKDVARRINRTYQRVDQCEKKVYKKIKEHFEDTFYVYQ